MCVRTYVLCIYVRMRIFVHVRMYIVFVESQKPFSKNVNLRISDEQNSFQFLYRFMGLFSAVPHVSRCLVSLSSSAPAHTIAQFTVCALQQSLTPPIPSAVTENFLFVCRQLYNTCEGLLVLKEYTLPKHIAAVWPQVSSMFGSTVSYVQCK